MTDEHKALQSFYKAIGPDLDELVIVRKDGISLNGKFSPAQLRLITTAYDDYLSADPKTPLPVMHFLL